MTGTTALRRILLGAWLGILAWPYAAASSVPHPFVVVVLPILLAAVPRLQRARYPMHVAIFLAAIWLLLLRHPGDAAALPGLLQTDHGVQRIVLSAFLILTVLLGWQVYRQADSGRRAFLLLWLGAAMLVVDERLWHLSTATALLLYLGTGLLILALPSADGLAMRPGLGFLLMTLLLMAVPIGAAIGAGSLAPEGSAQPPTGTLPLSNAIGVPSRYRAANGAGQSGVPGPGAVSLNRSVRLSPTPLERVLGAPPGLYWVVAVYDRFDGTSWLPPAASSRQVIVGPLAGVPFAAPFTHLPTRSVVVTVAATSEAAGDALIYSGAPQAVLAANGLGPVLAYPAAGTLRQQGATSWRLQLALPNFAAVALGRVPFGVPPVRLGRDLEVPRGVPAAVGRIARSLRQGSSGPYDLALRVRRYLRTHEVYSTSFPSATRGGVVGQFLLQSHRGYCDQFSTAFVMLMRMDGVPTRWVVGYAPGQYDAASRTTLLRAEDAHSWAEVFVQGYGWVPVDPTPPSLAPLPRSPSAAKALPHWPGSWLLALAALAALALALSSLLRRRAPTAHSEVRRAAGAADDLFTLFDRRLCRRRTQTLRDALGNLPGPQQEALQPVVEALERWLYAGRPPSSLEVRRCRQALDAVGRRRGNPP